MPASLDQLTCPRASTGLGITRRAALKIVVVPGLSYQSRGAELWRYMITGISK